MDNNNIRDRFRAANKRRTQELDSKDSIFDLWEDQKRMQAEDKRLAQELRRAKAQTKELKSTLRKHQLGQGTAFASQKLSTISTSVKDTARRIKVKQLRTKRRQVAAAVLAVAVLVGVGSLILLGDKESSQTGLLGDNTGIVIQDDLPRETPSFKPLTPNGVSQEDYDIVRISPDNAAPSYTFLDRFTDSDVIFRVTQQEVPPNFDLAKTATDFQATSIIQIDDMPIYHGYSEKGSTQSLIFIKDQKLISIRSPQKFSDDIWAAYILSLK